ncbi:MAG TPA: hypothetical protein VJK51_03325 [Candidatus Nanoarchaeia archaeon]|nr:hypothetical protein [Candidatus Nanoarchaeia archaeon]
MTVIEIPEELERRAKLLNIKLSLWAVKILKEQLERMEEIEQFKKSIAHSNLTESDVEELTDKANTSMWQQHKKKFYFPNYTKGFYR